MVALRCSFMVRYWWKVLLKGSILRIFIRLTFQNEPKRLSLNITATRFMFKIVRSLWNLAGVYTAVFFSTYKFVGIEYISWKGVLSDTGIVCGGKRFLNINFMNNVMKYWPRDMSTGNSNGSDLGVCLDSTTVKFQGDTYIQATISRFRDFVL